MHLQRYAEFSALTCMCCSKQALCAGYIAGEGSGALPATVVSWLNPLDSTSSTPPDCPPLLGPAGGGPDPNPTYLPPWLGGTSSRFDAFSCSPDKSCHFADCAVQGVPCLRSLELHYQRCLAPIVSIKVVSNLSQKLSTLLNEMCTIS